MGEPALQATFRHYLAVLEVRDADLRSIDAELVPWFSSGPFAEQVGRLGAYRGIDQLGALTLVSEVCDFRRFASAQMFMGFCGLVPSEHSSGERTRRGRITKAGNAHLRRQLVESAWSYRFPANLADRMCRRQEGLPRETVTRAWAAQLRLCGRFRRLAARKESKTIVATAIARELALQDRTEYTVE